MLQLTRATVSGLSQNGATDPIAFYKKPLVGWIFRERINMGLRLLDAPKYARVLEVGYGAGAVLLTLAPLVDELHGLDLDAAPAPVEAMLRVRGVSAKLVQGSVYELPYGDGSFDLTVCFSVFEHLHEFERGLREVARVLRPGGQFLLGMPAVNRMMEAGFRVIGFKEINDHHVTTPKSVSDRFSAVDFRIKAERTLAVPVTGLNLYYTWLLEKP
jgi:ubiquinone/menaquinone biosynthesis C-methylase UbiE